MLGTVLSAVVDWFAKRATNDSSHCCSASHHSHQEVELFSLPFEFTLALELALTHRLWWEKRCVRSYSRSEEAGKLFHSCSCSSGPPCKHVLTWCPAGERGPASPQLRCHTIKEALFGHPSSCELPQTSLHGQERSPRSPALTVEL